MFCLSAAVISLLICGGFLWYSFFYLKINFYFCGQFKNENNV